jgi:hypothetical protein
VDRDRPRGVLEGRPGIGAGIPRYLPPTLLPIGSILSVREYSSPIRQTCQPLCGP